MTVLYTTSLEFDPCDARLRCRKTAAPGVGLPICVDFPLDLIYIYIYIIGSGGYFAKKTEDDTMLDQAGFVEKPAEMISILEHK